LGVEGPPGPGCPRVGPRAVRGAPPRGRLHLPQGRDRTRSM
jgi:hypothetical protein